MIAAMLLAICDGRKRRAAGSRQYARLVGDARRASCRCSWLWFWVRRAGFRFALRPPAPDPRRARAGRADPAGGVRRRHLPDQPLHRPVLPRPPGGRLLRLPGAWPTGSTSCRSASSASRWARRSCRRCRASSRRTTCGGAQRVQSNAIELGLLLTIPAAVGLFICRRPAGQRVLLSAASSTADDVAVTAATSRCW